MAWAETIAQISTGLIGVLGTLGGTMLANRHNRRDRQEQIERERHALLRSKAEELYAELTSVVDFAKQNISSALRSEYLQEDASTELVLPTERVEALIAIYFPSALPIFEQYEQDRIAQVAPLMEQIEEAAASHNTAQFRKAVTEATKAVGNSVAALNGRIRRHLNPEIAKLK